MAMRTACLIAAMALSTAAGQPLANRLAPPYGPTNKLVSPDGAYALLGSADAPELWLQDTRTPQQRKVFQVTLQTLTLAWSPDSKAFIANDRTASDVEYAYIYDVKTLQRLDLRNRILAVDPEASHFVPSRDISTHSYFHAIRWLDANHIAMQLHGHTDSPQNGTSVQCFDFRYRVSKDGAVQKLSRLVAPVASKACDHAEGNAP